MPITGRVLVGTLLVGTLSCLACAAARAAAEDSVDNTYSLHFSAELGQSTRVVSGRIDLQQTDHVMRELSFAAPHTRFHTVKGDGEIRRQGDRVIWLPPPTGGSLRYDYMATKKKASAYDARLTPDWAIFRLDSLFPPAKVRTLKTAQGSFSVQFKAPAEWALESRFGDLRKRRQLPESTRKYQRPTGWFVGGELGIRRTTIGERRIVVAAPKGTRFRRMDTLAFLRWTLPLLETVFSGLDERLLIVGAPPGMWYGGLSGPGSLFLHSNLPLISENGTSVLLHELAHLAGLHSATAGGDWIVEGLAEYYSLEILRRSGALSDKRFNASLDSLRQWVARDKGQLSDPSKGVDTMAAVLHFHGLNQRLNANGHSLDTVVAALLSGGEISPDALDRQVQALLGKP